MKKLAVILALVSLVILAIGCANNAEENSEEANAKVNVKFNGAGASFPRPVYERWIYDYNAKTGAKIDYESIGSGGGQKAIIAKTVNFAGSDAPMSPEKLEDNGLVQFPMIVGGIVPVYNLPEIKTNELKLTPELLGKIFSAQITKWNDPAIAQMNPDLKLPAEDIKIVHRSDSSGTTWTFTYYLDQVSKAWHENMKGVKIDKATGEILEVKEKAYDKAIKWSDDSLGAKGNEGVATTVKSTEFAIGYVEFAYALTNELATVKMQNKDGAWVTPAIESFQEAAAAQDWSGSGEALVPVNQGGSKTWPIVGVSFILVHKEQADPVVALEMLKYFDWCFSSGADAAKELHYVPIPASVTDAIKQTWASSIVAEGNPVWK